MKRILVLFLIFVFTTLSIGNAAEVKGKNEYISPEYSKLMNMICSYPYLFCKGTYMTDTRIVFGKYASDMGIPITSDTNYSDHELPFGNMEKIQITLIDPYNYAYKIKSMETGREVLCRDKKATSIKMFLEHIVKFLDQYLEDANIKEKYNISDADWRQIRDEAIEAGFSKRMVLLALGRPWDVSKTTTSTEVSETVIYKEESGNYIFILLINDQVVSITQ